MKQCKFISIAVSGCLKWPSVFCFLLTAGWGVTSSNFAQSPFNLGQYNWGDYNWGEYILPTGDAPWTGSFATGVNGRSGNANTTDVNLNLVANRETERFTQNLIGNYFYARNNSVTVNNRAFGQLRHEQNINEIWAIFFQSAIEFDRFRDFDYRLALHGGLSREVFRDELGFWKVRFGAGASREFGAVDSEWIPELQFGTDWERQLTDRLKAFAIVDFYPNVSDFSDYRLNSNVGLNYLVDAPRNISLRIFAITLYDSTPPAGNKPSDIDYGAALSFGF